MSKGDVSGQIGIRRMIRRTCAAVTLSALGAAGSIGFSAPAMAQTNLVTNGSFGLGGATEGFQFGFYFGDTGTLTGWTSNAYNFVFYAGNALATSTQQNPQGAYTLSLNGPSSGSANGFTYAGPNNSNYLALDAATAHDGAVTQTISGLTVGQSYVLSFAWAGAQQTGYSGATSDSLQVGFGTATDTTSTINVASQGFTGWMTQTYDFVATASSQTLSFLASSPSTTPPFVLVSNVGLYVPEPNSVALLMAGFIGLAALRWKRDPSGSVA